jgi:hypothetical protein
LLRHAEVVNDRTLDVGNADHPIATTILPPLTGSPH